MLSFDLIILFSSIILYSCKYNRLNECKKKFETIIN